MHQLNASRGLMLVNDYYADGERLLGSPIMAVTYCCEAEEKTHLSLLR